MTDECLRMYKSLGFLRLQRYPMLVDGTMIDFMVDCEPRMTDLVFESTWSQGINFRKLCSAVEM